MSNLDASFAAPAPSHGSAAVRSLSPDSQSRRRRALLKLARRNGEVEVIADGASDMLSLLDLLNERGLLRYGGARRSDSGVRFVYLPA